jgi:DNA-binding NarL/FixJ family response regulator
MIKVLIVDDIKILRECLRLAIEKEDRFNVVGTAADGKEAVEMTARLEPDIILMDLYMPVYSGYAAIKDIKAMRSKAKILVLTVDGNEKNIAQAFKDGADGYILKDICPEELSQAMLYTYNGIEYNP